MTSRARMTTETVRKLVANPPKLLLLPLISLRRHIFALIWHDVWVLLLDHQVHDIKKVEDVLLRGAG